VDLPEELLVQTDKRQVLPPYSVNYVDDEEEDFQDDFQDDILIPQVPQLPQVPKVQQVPQFQQVPQLPFVDRLAADIFGRQTRSRGPVQVQPLPDRPVEYKKYQRHQQ
jgi:hypothetical protein